MISTPLLSYLAAYHLLAYGTLLGTELYQTFIITKICFKALPISSFTQLQKRLFPVYFKSQLLLIALTVITLPSGLLRTLALWSAEPERKYDVVPLGVAGFMSILNLFVYGPKTRALMLQRVHQETRDGKKYNDEEQSPEMKALDRMFSRAHAMSIHLNLVAIAATLWYGIRLAGKIQVS